MIFENRKGNFFDASEALGLKNTEGWWHDVEPADLNADGKPDFVIGNHGLNTFFKAVDRMYVHDFDGNGSIEQIFCTKIGDKYYPVADKDELLSQLPSLKKSLLYYREYGKRTVDELFPNDMLKEARIFEVSILSSIVLLSGQNGYKIVELPAEAQYSSVYALLINDIDGDGIQDLIAGGNQYGVKPQFGRQDASACWFFKGSLTDRRFSFGKGHALGVKGEVRDIESVEFNGVSYILFAKYDDELEILKIHK
jgi:hypothetical protein